MTPASGSQEVADADAMERLGASWAQHCRAGFRIYLQGELGSGKTTWVRGFLRGFGYTGSVKSPSYALTEQYKLQGQVIVHFDLYRLTDVEEMEWLGARDWFDETTICLVEWPERGAGALPAPDVLVQLEYRPLGRRFSATGQTDRGRALVDRLNSLSGN